MDLSAKVYDKLSNSAVNAIQKGSYRWVNLIEDQFPDPKNPNKRIKLGPYQIDFVDTIQFGYPVRSLRDFEVLTKPTGVIFITRRQVGKSVMCGCSGGASMIIGPGFGNTPPCLNGIIAASEEESKLLIDKVKYNIENSDFNDFIDGKPKANLIKLINGSLTRSHTCSHKSIRGPSYHYVFIDESAQMEEDILFSAAIPTVEHGERWIAITTPQGSKGKLINHYVKSVATRPVICMKCGKQYSQRDFHDVSFPDKNKIWEMPKLPACGKCGGFRYKYGVGLFATPYLDPWKTPIIDQEKLRAELEAFDYSPWIRQEKLGEILDEASMIILLEWLDKNTNKHLKNKMIYDQRYKYIIGVDYGRVHDASSFCVMHDNGKRKQLDYMRTVSGEFDYQTDYHAIHKHMGEIVSFYKPSLLIVDSTGAGQPMIEMVEKDIKSWSRKTKIYNNSRKSKGFIISRVTKPDLIGNLIAMLSQNPPQIEMPSKLEPEIEKLRLELLNFECEVKDTGYIEYGTQDYHDDRVIAFALALWGFRGYHSYRTKPRGVVHDPFNKKGRENYGYGKNKTAKAVKYGF